MLLLHVESELFCTTSCDNLAALNACACVFPGTMETGSVSLKPFLQSKLTSTDSSCLAILY